jgi:predicted lipoprotein with Yx(FWY)xxD motif
VRARPRRVALILVTALAGVATAALVSIAVAKTFTLEIAKNAKVSDMGAMSQTATIVVTSSGRAVYTLSGDSKTHQKCTKAQCWGFWPPVTVAAGKKATVQKGIKGKVGVWHHSGINQVTLGGHPLYRFYLDKSKDNAHGDGIVAFGGTWHIVKASARRASTNTGTSPQPTNPYGY